MMGLDIGPSTINQFQQIIRESNTIVWNGPMGKYEENERLAEGTLAIVSEVKEKINQGKKVIIGGGDTAGLVRKYTEGLNISTGGGATLALLEGKQFKGL